MKSTVLLRLTDSFRGSVRPFDYVMYEQGARVEAEQGSEILAYTGIPYFNRTYDRFSSHCQTAFDRVTGWPAITRKGNVIYIANRIFADYIHNGVKIYRTIVEKCIKELVNKPLLITGLPSVAEVTLRRQENRMVLHILSYIPQRRCPDLDIVEDVIPLFNVEIKLRLDKAPVRVYLAPSEQEIPFKWDGEYLSAVIPEVRGHQIFVAEQR